MLDCGALRRSIFGEQKKQIMVMRELQSDNTNVVLWSFASVGRSVEKIERRL